MVRLYAVLIVWVQVHVRNPSVHTCIPLQQAAILSNEGPKMVFLHHQNSNFSPLGLGYVIILLFLASMAATCICMQQYINAHKGRPEV